MPGPDVSWYLVVSAILFAIGALGVLLRRSPLIVLLSLEIMLNAANLALIAFARLHGNHDGQIFALAVMAVAASEVVVGLGLIVAVARKRLDLDVDQLRTLRGWMIVGAWLCLLAPLAGALAITLLGDADLAADRRPGSRPRSVFVAFAGAIVGVRRPARPAATRSGEQLTDRLDVARGRATSTSASRSSSTRSR